LPYLILSHFDPIIGPKRFLQAPGIIDEKILKQIPQLMNLYDEKGFFVHIFEKVKSANMLFEIPNKSARGDIDTLLISVVITEGDLNVNLYKELLNSFVKEMQNIKNAYQSLYRNSEKIVFNQEKFDEVQSLFYTFYRSLPEEDIIKGRRDARIFVFGLSQAGKTSIIQRLQKNISPNTIPTTNVNISRILVNNLSILTYDAPGQIKFRSLWEIYLNKTLDGLVFVLDSIYRANFKEAREVLHSIAMHPKLKNLPLLILINKVDLRKPNVKAIVKELEINKLGDRDVKYFLTSAIANQGIDEAFNWLGQRIAVSLNISRGVVSPSKIKEGIILSRWDENTGLEILSVYPKNNFEDPEIIAIRCFSISEFIFGGEKFKKVSFILPFTHLKSKAAIYFDYVIDPKIRGGKLPLSLVVFYSEQTPKAQIELFDNYIFEKFSHFKAYYKDISRIESDLKEIYNQLFEKKTLKSETIEKYPPTIKSKYSKAEFFEDFIKIIKSENNYDNQTRIISSEISLQKELKCSICRRNIKINANMFQTKLRLEFICDNCYLNHSKEELNLILNLFDAYGGYYGCEKDINAQNSEIIKKLAIEIKRKTRNNSIDLDSFKLKIIHKALLRGISLELYEKELKKFFN